MFEKWFSIEAATIEVFKNAKISIELDNTALCVTIPFLFKKETESNAKIKAIKGNGYIIGN